jgi:hypothetical protein
MINVFASYQRHSSAMLANLIREKLLGKGIKVFVDTYDMDYSGEFPELLRREIEQAQVFLCLLGATTLESKWVLEEIEYASSIKKTLIPVFQEDYVSPKEPIPTYVDVLLKHNGVTVLDKRNIYIDEAMSKLERMIKGIEVEDLPKGMMPLGTSSHQSTASVEIKLDLSKSDLNLDKLLTFISGLTQIGVSQISVTTVRSGSTIVQLEMPTKAAEQLKIVGLADREFVEEFKVQSVTVALATAYTDPYTFQLPNLYESPSAPTPPVSVVLLLLILSTLFAIPIYVSVEPGWLKISCVSMIILGFIGLTYIYLKYRDKVI